MTAKDTEQLPEALAPQNGYHVTEQVGHLLRKAYQRHLSIFQTNASDPDLTSVQFVTLCALHDLGPSSQVELVKATSVDQATIRGIVERLKARGLIDLSKDEADGRKVVISLLPKGEALLEEMYPRAHLISEETVSRLNPAERIALLYLLRKIADDECAEL
ncbi:MULTISPECIES: MarR family transcriptional regulator [unclassified Rhizobium]|uniref:MarR family winged helix-turn-helix transcriptional regulator n=1 Tax=unclassified Rhizobium TaxID=2613769 RepID=UPI0015D254D7|nr:MULTISPECIES: MarR family transcriptional regulator [unclassified Rhizobium]MBA1349837.1 MarR family transcriptional regulator [Rhizobium sp. WYCCWR 11146]NYT33613.1 MarR family transcriptional regulator [Rhizobium sp. WYCCWR 11128]